jgi:DNA-binding GntR family transcriptional regulator
MTRYLAAPGFAGSLVEKAYDWLKSQIMSDSIAAGETIDDREVAARLGLSRTPVRDAIQILRVQGFVEVIPRKGTRVAHITLADLREVYQAITALEVEAVVLAATRKPGKEELAPLRQAVADMVKSRPVPDPTVWIKCDERFHRGLLTLSGNRRIEQVGLGFRDYAQRAHLVASRLRPIPGASEQAHAELIDLIEAGEVEEARRRHTEQRRSGEVGLIGAVERAGIRAL